MSVSQATRVSTRPGLGVWFQAIRPKTLPAALAPVAVGTAVAYAHGAGRALPALAAGVAALLIQIATNLVNDYYDFVKGADTAERIGPRRVTQSGLVAPGTVFRAALATFAMAAVVGAYLVWIGGWPILVVGVLSLLSGWAYTGGPYPLGYNGLGDVFVFVFFGLVAVSGTYYVQAGTLSAEVVTASVSMAALSTALLVVNNLRDVDTDRVAGKRTLAVRLGPGAARGEYVAMVALAFAVPVGLWLGFDRPWALLALGALPLAVPMVRLVVTRSGPVLNRGLGGTGGLLIVFGALLSIGLLIGGR